MLHIFFFSTLKLYLFLEAQILRLALKQHPQTPSSRDVLSWYVFVYVPFRWLAYRI